MAFYIAFKDIRAFFERERAVFIRLIVCMTAGAFVLCYSYSTARYDGLLYEHDIGADIPTYTIWASGVPSDTAGKLAERIAAEKLPGLESYQIFGNDDGVKVVGSTFISEKSSAYTGCWVMGYDGEIKNTGENVCAVSIEIFDSAFELKDTVRYVRGVPFKIKGAYEEGVNDVVIFADKFAELFDSFDNMRLTFGRLLTSSEAARFGKLVSELIPGSFVDCPPEAGETGRAIVFEAQMKYSFIIILMVICLVSILRYWQSVNVAATTVYWLCGAEKNDLLLVSLCETLMLCVPTFLAGLGINALSRLFTVRSAGLQPLDVLLGFGIFFVTFALSSLVSVERNCKKLNVTNIRS